MRYWPIQHTFWILVSLFLREEHLLTILFQSLAYDTYSKILNEHIAGWKDWIINE